MGAQVESQNGMETIGFHLDPVLLHLEHISNRSQQQMELMFSLQDFFPMIGGISKNSIIAQWNGAEWLSLLSGLDNLGYSIINHGTTIYVGGLFPTSGDVNPNQIAKFNCTQNANPWLKEFHSIFCFQKMLQNGNYFLNLECKLL